MINFADPTVRLVLAWVAGIMFALWLLLLPFITLLFYWALMHVDKMKHQGLASKQAIFIAEKLMLPVGLFNNLCLAWTWGPFYYGALPRYVGLTKFTNAMVARGGWRAQRGLRIRELYLNYYDRRGIHT